MTRDVVSAYTLIVGDEHGQATVLVYGTAEEAWRALDRAVRGQPTLRMRSRRAVDPETTTKLADEWRAGNPEERFWQILSHQLAVRIPEIGRQREFAGSAARR